MTITKIAVQQKDPNRVNIFVDNSYAVSLTLDQLLQQKIKIGAVLSDADLKVLHKLSEDGKLRARALEWVLLRPRSAFELKTYLLKKQADADVQAAILTEFADKKYQDDAMFARWWIENRVRKNKSDIAIRTELMQKGISRKIIDDVLPGALSQKERLRALVAKKRLVPKYKADSLKFKKFLQRKGYSYSDIEEVLGEAIDGDDEGSF